MSKAFIGGFVLGLFLVAMVAYLLKKAGKREVCKYDERQELQRGRAFKYGFFTLMIYDLVLGAACSDGLPGWCDALVFQCIGVGIALLVFVSYCIWKDAYVSLTEQPKKVCVLIVAALLVNIAAGAMNIVHRGIFTGGVLTIGAVNIILAVVLLVIMVEFLLKLWLDKRGVE